MTPRAGTGPLVDLVGHKATRLAATLDRNEQVSSVERPRYAACLDCRTHGARGGAPTGKRNGNYRQVTRTGGDSSSEISQLVVALGAEILRMPCSPCDPVQLNATNVPYYDRSFLAGIKG